MPRKKKSGSAAWVDPDDAPELTDAFFDRAEIRQGDPYVRVLQLQSRARALAKGARTFATHDEPDKKTLKAALEDSSRRIEEWLRLAAEGAKGVRTFKRGLVQTLAYLVAHESHHRGSILLTLKQCGHALDSTTRYAIWDWDRV